MEQSMTGFEILSDHRLIVRNVRSLEKRLRESGTSSGLYERALNTSEDGRTLCGSVLSVILNTTKPQYSTVQFGIKDVPGLPKSERKSVTA